MTMPKYMEMRLNPCFNGIYSQRSKIAKRVYQYTSLNPCFNGRYSQRRQRVEQVNPIKVLILVLMEDTLRDRIMGKFIFGTMS